MLHYLKVTSHQGPDDLQSALEGCAAVVIPAGVPRKPGTQALKQFSIECRKTKVITLTNHKGRRQYNEPIKTRSNYMWRMLSAGKHVQLSHDWFWFYFWLDEQLLAVVF